MKVKGRSYKRAATHTKRSLIFWFIYQKASMARVGHPKAVSQELPVGLTW